MFACRGRDMRVDIAANVARGRCACDVCRRAIEDSEKEMRNRRRAQNERALSEERRRRFYDRCLRIETLNSARAQRGDERRRNIDQVNITIDAAFIRHRRLTSPPSYDADDAHDTTPPRLLITCSIRACAMRR